MKLEEIRTRWTGRAAGKSELQKQFWDQMAQDEGERRLPDFENDPFLKIVQSQCSLPPDAATLDVGCGAGRYSLALAGRVGRAVGVDLSERMIDAAKASAQRYGVQNAEFLSMDWAQADVDALGWRGAFDLVFAHMTPAIMDLDTLEKMIACARRWCILEKHCRRTDKVLDQALCAAGIQPKMGFDEALTYVFAALWELGFEPRVQYRRQEHKTRLPVEIVLARTFARAQLWKPLNEQERRAMESAVRAHDEGGMVEETLSSTVVSVIWEV